ncbi:MAG: CoA transferase [Betaproteobacteria bacterium]|nr:CoA transferase [Betaproteobacteria bacterium]
MARIQASPALARLRILDLTRVRAGPTCVRQFADFGADVIKVETPGDEDLGGARDGSDFQNLHRNKRSITLDLKAPAGRDIFRRLVATADVVVENYRPDVKDRLGIDYASLRAINPRIILASISGFGQDGPYRDRPGFDQIAQGLCGIMSVTGFPGQGPLRAGAAVADVTAGLLAALGIMTALLEREVSGEGQWVQSNLLQAGITLLDFQAARYTMDGQVPPQVGNDHPTSMPTSAYRTADGHINVAASGSVMWMRLCEAIGRPELADDPRFRRADDRAANRAALAAEIESALQTRPSAEWVSRLNDAGVPCGPIYRMDEVFADPQVKHLGAAAPVNHPRLGTLNILNQAVRLSRTPAALATATPERGEHTDEVLREIGVTEAEIALLRGGRVIL